MKKVIDDTRLIFKCCSLYYQDRKGQQEICDILGIDPKSFDNDNSDESLIDLKDVLNRTVAFDGHTLDENDAELIKSLLENMVKNKD